MYSDMFIEQMHLCEAILVKIKWKCHIHQQNHKFASSIMYEKILLYNINHFTSTSFGFVRQAFQEFHPDTEESTRYALKLTFTLGALDEKRVSLFTTDQKGKVNKNFQYN